MPAALDLPAAGSAAIAPSRAAHAVGAVLVIARLDVERQLRNPGVLLAQLVQVGFFVLVFAVGVGGMVGEVEGVPFGAFAFAGIVLLQAITVSVSSGLTYAWDREFGVLREMLVAPVPRVCLPLGKALGSVALVTLQSAALLGCGPLLGVPLTVASYALAVACCAATAAAFSLLSLYLAMAIRGVETLQAAIQLARAAAAAGAGARPTVAGAAAALAVEQRADGGFGPGGRGAPRAALTLTCAWALAALRQPELAGAGRQAQAQIAAVPAVSSRRKKPASRSPSTASSSTGPS